MQSPVFLVTLAVKNSLDDIDTSEYDEFTLLAVKEVTQLLGRAAIRLSTLDLDSLPLVSLPQDCTTIDCCSDHEDDPEESGSDEQVEENMSLLTYLLGYVM